MPPFHALSLSERRAFLLENGFDASILEHFDLTATDLAALDKLTENVIGAFPLGLSLVRAVLVNGREHSLPMVTEEPSVVAGANKASKIFKSAGGVVASVGPNLMQAQIQVLVPDAEAAESLRRKLGPKREAYLTLANALDPKLCAAGGGARQLDIEILAPSDDACPEYFVVLALTVDCGAAMGANALNTMAEGIKTALIQDFGCEVLLAILSNRPVERLVQAQVHLPMAILEGLSPHSGPELARRLHLASALAERSPERASTHNKGILNALFGLGLALGQDLRALAVAAIDHACRSGRHRPLSTWRRDADGLLGELALPIVAGFIGGASHKLAAFRAAFALAQIEDYNALCELFAALALAQNFAALLALSTEGIQKSHMHLHLR